MAPPEKPIESMKKTSSSKRNDPLSQESRKTGDELSSPDPISKMSDQITLMINSFGQFKDQLQQNTSIAASAQQQSDNIASLLNKMMQQQDLMNNELTTIRGKQQECDTRIKDMDERFNIRLNQMQQEFEQKLLDKYPEHMDTTMEDEQTAQPPLPLSKGSAASKYATNESQVSSSPNWGNNQTNNLQKHNKNTNPTNQKNIENTNNSQKNNDTSLQTNSTSNPPRQRSKQQCLRHFAFVSPNQGFQYLHLPIKAKLPLKEMRYNLRKIGLSGGSIIDVQYPTSSVVSILVHNDYVQTALNVFEENKLPIIQDFDPLDPKYLKDPKYKDDTNTLKITRLRELQQKRFQQTLAFLRPPVQLAVARDFVRKGWISDIVLTTLLAQTSSQSDATHNENPVLANFVIDTGDQNTPMDIPNSPPPNFTGEEDIDLSDTTSLVGDGQPTPSS